MRLRQVIETEKSMETGEVLIGVTGHRCLAEQEKLTAGIDAALRTIGGAYPGRTLTLLSPLAEGADRLVADAVLRLPGGRLVALLPLPRADYMEDFASFESKAEFLRLLARAAQAIEFPSATRREAYAAVGREIVERSDALVAVWDGQGAQGLGGTAEVVAYARSLGKPLVIVRAGNRKPGTDEPTSLGAAQGQLIVERLDRAK